MGNAEERPRAVAISAFDLPDSADLLVHGCEDCACAVSHGHTRDQGWPAPAPSDLLIRAGDAREFTVDDEHWAVFNPTGNGGVVVIDALARQVLRCFDRPVCVMDVEAAATAAPADVTQVVSRLLQANILHPAGRPVRPEFRPPTTLTAWLHVSNQCNLRCTYCYVHKSASGMDQRVGRASVDAVLNSACAHGLAGVKLKYAGGEASLNWKLVLELDAYGRSRAAELGLDFQAVLLSNGVALRPTLIAALKASGVKVMISLDGIHGTHDRQRPTLSGQGSFRLIEKSIAQLLAQGYPPHLSITVTSQSAAGVADTVRFALDRDLTFSLNFFRDNECAAGVAGLRYTEDEMVAGLMGAFAVIRERMPRWSVLGSVLDRGQLLEPRQRPCGVGQDYVVIDENGRVAKCHMELERTLGDVFRDDPLTLVRNDTRTTLNLLVEEKEGCRDCSWRYWCAGGCPVSTFAATGRYDVKSPNCGIYKAIYPEALKLEALRLLVHATGRRRI
jgi:uncharacterized protein